MSLGEFFTRATVWLALSGYALGAAGLLPARQRPRWQARARWAWTVGCLALLAHVICGLNYFHHWSQAAAYRETARQTAAVVGLDWGGGLIINYLFLAAWLTDTVLWWQKPDGYLQRPAWLIILWHAVALFIIFNALVVFKTGVLRGLGVLLCLGLGGLWWLTRSRRAPGLNQTSGGRGSEPIVVLPRLFSVWP